MKTFFILFLCLIIVNSHIYTSTPKVTYDYTGAPQIYHFYMMLDTGLGSTDFLHIKWPTAQIIHASSDKKTVLVKLISFLNNLEVASAYCTDDGATTTSDYYVTFGYKMQQNTWYQVKMFPTLNLATIPSTNLVQLFAKSTYLANSIIYDQNLAFAYIDVQAQLSSSNTLGFDVNPVSVSTASTPASIYSINIDVTPSISNQKGGNFTLEIYYNAANSTHNSGTGQKDFNFMGLCQSTSASAGVSAVVLNFCSISSDLSTITFSVAQVVAGTKIRITTQVQNPLYKSIRGIRGFWTDFISGIVKQNGKKQDSLQVVSIAINNLGTDRIYLHWGLQKSYTDSDLTGVQLYKSQISTPNIGPYNSFNIGFSFSQTSPIDGQYRVRITIMAQGILQGSLVFNFPPYQDKTVYCHYVTTQIYCENVGPFINTNFRYFISGKAFFNSNTAGAGATGTLTTFGDIYIDPIILDSSGNQYATVSLYTPLTPAQSITVRTSKQFLDSGSGGFHHRSAFKFGNAKIVSARDDGTLSSTADAVLDVLQGTNTTIGIVPDLGVSQQLLFMMKVTNADIGSAANGRSFVTKILYNNQVIGFQSGSQTKGLDFVGYQNSTGLWSISLSPCFKTGNVVCEKYNNDTQTKNMQVKVGTSSSTSNFYGMYKFSCGDAYVATAPCATADCLTQCNMFRGYSNLDMGSTVMSMRKVTFPINYHSSVYADTNLLDFIVIFTQGGNIVTTSLINAYTVVGAKMQNIKAAYVNYYDDGSNYNKGVRFPMLLRIGGGVLPTQSRGATVIGVFFDDNVQASTFYTQKDESYEIGCSTSDCLYYPNLNLNNFRNDIWPTNRRVEFYSIPSIQNEFNLLVPVTPSNHVAPQSLTIVFFAQNYTVQNVTGLLRTLSAYRIYGPVVAGLATGALTTINGLALFGSTNSDQTSSSYGSISYAINTTKITDNPPNNTISFGFSTGLTYGSTFGSGVTITSLYYNIFASSSLQFESPPSNTASTCSIFGYVYNQVQNGLNIFRDGQWNYLAFCPIDSTFNLASSAANIDFNNPQYPLTFTTGFPLRGILTYAVSDQVGRLQGYRHQTTSISNFQRQCTTIKSPQYTPTTSGKQRSIFSITTPQIVMNGDGFNGYPRFRVTFQWPSATVASAGFTMSTACQISDPLLTCTYFTHSSYNYTFEIQYQGSTSYTVTYFELGLYATVSSTFGTATNYLLTVYLPQYNNGNFAPFGDKTLANAYTSQTTYCSCQSTFTVGITASGQLMNFQNLIISSQMANMRSSFQFDFGSRSYRDAFFKSSSFVFNFGFLYQPTSTYLSRGDFKCLIYQNNGGVLTLSNDWQTLTLSAPLSSVTLSPKAQISTPASILYTMACQGGAVPNGGSTSNMTLNWVDAAANVQIATQIAPVTYLASSFSTPTLTIQYKRFRTQGFKSFYTFKLVTPFAINQNTRFYFNFHSMMSSKLDNQGIVQCYTRTNLAIVDTQAQYSYCEFIDQRQLSVWNNQIMAAGATLYIDIFNIEQPMSANITSTNRMIGLTIDTDDNFTNGANAYSQVNDFSIQPLSNAVTRLTILSTSMSNNYIRTTQNVEINLQTLSTIFATGFNIYVMYPASYQDWIQRGATLSIATKCKFVQTGQTTNLATSCTYISKRILKITVTTSSATLFTLKLNDINSPSYLPAGKDNEYRFKLFCVTNTNQDGISHFSFADFSDQLTLVNDQSLIDLTWMNYQISQSSQIITLSKLSTNALTVYTGYYASATELRQQIYPNNFQATLSLAVSNYATTDFVTISGGFTIELGKSQGLFRIAAKEGLSPGLYELQFTKTGDTNNKYTSIPPLSLVVNTQKCSLTTQSNSYIIPLGGQTLPVIISGINCIPVDFITITPIIPILLSSEVNLLADLSSTTLRSSVIDGRLYFIFKHTAGSLAVGSSVTVTFSITGTNSGRYNTISPITLTFVDPTTFNNIPVATAVPAPVLQSNRATFTLQCSQASTIYWGLGIFPSILNTQALDFQARIISGETGLTSNFTQVDDYHMRVYGINSVSTSQVLTKTLYNLKSSTNYIFKYFCQNQRGFISDSQSVNFTSLNYGAYLMKVQITFRDLITYKQYHDLSCSLAQNFMIPYKRVMTQAMTYCGHYSQYIFYPTDVSPIANPPDSSGEYIYNFYILPDYTISQDTTNTDARNSLSLHSFTSTIIASTNNFLDLPSLVQMQTQDLQVFTTPTMSISEPISGLNSVVISASITNMNGFIIFGVMDGVFNSTTMTLPTTNLIKGGLFSDTQPLVSTKMIYSTQNYNTSFEFDGLTDNKEYSFFYFSTCQDPTFTATSSTVRVVNAKTLQALTIDINWDGRSTLTMVLIALLIVMMWG